ncbi:MAG: DUF63 family protein [Halobacteriota archaeon]
MFPETSTERAWTAAVVVIVVGLVGGSLLFPDLVYGSFIWQYFWGPVYADAFNAACAAWNGGSPQLYASSSACEAAGGPTAYPGYTLVSEVGYALTLIFSLVGVVFLLRRLELGEKISFIYPLIPFMLLGGALRVVEDAMNAVPDGIEPAIQYPLNTLLISPFIYFTVFFMTVGALLVSIWAERTALTETFEWPLAGIGTAMLVGTLGYLGYLSVSTTYVYFHPVFTVLTMGGAFAIAIGLWIPIRRRVPWMASGTPVLGGVILWAHSVDGVSNVLALDWGQELGLPADLVPKHPVNRGIIEISESVLPESVASVIGTAWPFLLVKVVAALVVIALFDEKMFDEDPRFAVLLLIAVIAVGLGPGTRDMLRATFGI